MSRATKKRRKEKLRESMNLSDSSVIKSHFETEIADRDGKKVDDIIYQNQSIREILQIEECNCQASLLFANLISPMSKSDFYSQFWRKEPFFQKRSDTMWYKDIFSKKLIENIINRRLLKCPKDIIVSRFSETTQEYVPSDLLEESFEEIEMKVVDIKTYINDGYTIKIFSPQKFSDKIWNYLSLLELEFDDIVACSISIVPTCRKGYGLIVGEGEQYYLQTSGRMRWMVYSTAECDPSLLAKMIPDKNGILPSDPSIYSFFKNSSPVIDHVLEEGDLLYVPKQYVVQCESCPPEESVFMTLTTHFSGTVRSMVDIIVPEAMGLMSSNSTSILNKPLPNHFLDFLGVARSEDDHNNNRKECRMLIKKGLESIVENAMSVVDAASDQIAKAFICSRLPILLSPKDLNNSAFGPNASSLMILPYTKLRIVRPRIARGIVEDGMVVVYHCMDNSREMHASPVNPLEFDLDDGPAIEALLESYPHGVTVNDLPHPSEELEDKLAIANALFKEGILLIMDDASQCANQSDDDDDPF